MVTKRYLLHFEEIGEIKLKEILCEVLSQSNILVAPTIEIIEEVLARGETIEIVSNGYKSAKSDLGKIPYGEFLKRLNQQTNLPIHIIHESIVIARKDKETPQELFNIVSLNNIMNAFEKKFETEFAQRFSYHALSFNANTSIFHENGEFKEFLLQGDVGVNEAKDLEKTRPNKAKYLYDKYLYDSEIEHEVLKVSPPEKIVVYGKLPRKSIKLPTYTGGTTSPDFVYAIKSSNSDNIKLHFIVETKSKNMRFSDKISIEAQQKAFATIGENIEWKMETDVTEFEKSLMKFVTD